MAITKIDINFPGEYAEALKEALQDAANVYDKSEVYTKTEVNSGFQPLNAILTSVSGLSVIPAGRFLYTTGNDTFAVSQISDFARTLLDDGSAAAARLTLGAVGNLLGVKVITTSGTYTPGANVKAIVVEAQGGGGGGGGASGTTTPRASTGGAAGGYCLKHINNPTGDYTISIGAGGNGGTADMSGANSGQNGGLTSFDGNGASLTASGGSGGSFASASTDIPYVLNEVLGGTASGGDINVRGGRGSRAFKISTASRAAGAGGDSKFGTGGRGYNANSSGGGAANGESSSGYGSGGGGAISSWTGSMDVHKTGGNGAPGLVVIWEFG